MSKPSVIILLIVLLLGLVLFLTGDGGSSDADVESLARDRARRATEAETKAMAESTNLELLAEKGLGQALPNYLHSELGPGGRFWFVGNPSTDSGVEIPFKPGTTPVPASDSEPMRASPGFMGAQACRSCHEKKYDTFVHTAHHRTSRLADADAISGSFAEGRNRMATSDRNVHFTMLKRGGRLFQRTSFFDWKFDVPIDLIIGSAKMAESYVYWHDDKLFQHNCTYLTEPDRWINSPGYVDGDAAYARPIQAGCIRCHATYIELREPPNHFTPSTLILGISCERCHGPGKDHVDYHVANPNQKKAQHVSVPSKLSRQQQLDVCGQCHTSQTIPKVETAFQFRPGDRLEDHYSPLEGHDTSANSVHTSNQVARLALSECFKQSEMGCVECHDPHRDERGQRQIFSERCMKCHQRGHCGMSDQLGSRIVEDCISCHMPARATGTLRFETITGNVFQPLRDHHIRVDQQATEEYLHAIGHELSK